MNRRRLSGDVDAVGTPDTLTVTRKAKEVVVTSEQAAPLQNALENLMDSIEKREPITDHLLHLSRLQKKLAPVTSPQLNHFLQNRSYTKALEYLRNGIVMEDPSRPDCDDDT